MDNVPEKRKRLPLNLISIELVRRLAEQMNTAYKFLTEDYQKLLPVGWYQTSFFTTLGKSEDPEKDEDSEKKHELVLIFEGEKEVYEEFMSGLISTFGGERLPPFDSLPDLKLEDLKKNDIEEVLAKWRCHFFYQESQSKFSLENNLFCIARHIAQNIPDVPPFFAFDERGNHNLTKLAQDAMKQNWTLSQKTLLLKQEYHSKERFWKTLYQRFDQFSAQFDSCLRGLEKRVPGKLRGIPQGMGTTPHMR